ncbi:ATP11 protein-domain-containing protein [Radiomyces spectabilis]|uniref:ATP11 protein-domain-containing protein n=1 Tax=Radiomyces spectabilis TaxID=64574 RepID=UPI002220B147|nr:ATP11 protein-domain-containing protein [Radiomyces spectabilis]KAI8381189.1 ATP11 protein-domain-containing protein [Radiomyces spectabilis]
MLRRCIPLTRLALAPRSAAAVSHFNNAAFRFRQVRARQFTQDVQRKLVVDYESKYADKLKKAAEKEGLTVEQLKARMAEEAAKKQKAAKPQPVKPKVTNSAEKVAATVTEKAKLPYDSSAPTLDKIVKLELLEKEDVDTIKKIWTEYHADKDCITAVIPSEMYDKLYKRSQDYPMFILPMPRETGVEFMFMQFNFHQCNFTSLLEYKAKGTEARPFLTITHFPELAKSKGIVLMKGDISDNPRMIDTQNAQFLAFALQQFYVTGGDAKLGLVEKFHKAPHTFDYQELINEVERII